MQDKWHAERLSPFNINSGASLSVCTSRHVHMHPWMHLQTRVHAHMHEAADMYTCTHTWNCIEKEISIYWKIVLHTHKALHKIRQHSQMGKSKRGLSFSRGEWRKQTATDSLCQFISINVKLAGVGAGIPHLHHQLSIKTLLSLVHKLLLSEKKKFQKKTSLETRSRTTESTAGMWQPFSGMEDLLHHPSSQHGPLLALVFSSADVQIPIMCH